MAASIVNSRHDRGPAVGITPPGYGYLLLGAAIAPPTGPPFVRPNRTRQRILERLAYRIDELRRVDGVERATGYRAVLMPPARPPTWRRDLQPPRFDVAALIETSSPDALATAADAPKIAALRDLLREDAPHTIEMRATCVRAIADVDKDPDGIYLFNFWAAQDVATALEVWDHLAPWFQSKTGLKNSTVLQPTDSTDFAFVNHARWDSGLLHIAANQFLRPSFYTFVRRNLDANQVHVYPTLYRRM
jgi:hypothetical protein